MPSFSHKIKRLVALALLFGAQATFGQCIISKSSGEPATGNGDLLFTLLTSQPSCPSNVIDLHDLLKTQGYSVKKSLVSNRGFHSHSDSFSLFEWVVGTGTAGVSLPGDFFLGHFTASDGQTLIADQAPDSGALMIELELKDPTKSNAYNFYELRGEGTESRWFYRGDSFDIYADLKALHLNAENEPSFGDRLRCSGCHLSGGPILKELASPHNDWFTTVRPLDLSAWILGDSLGDMLSHTPQDAAKRLPTSVSDANDLAALVKSSSLQLIQSPGINAKRNESLSLPERLRPLFCPMELNLESSPQPIDEGGDITVPSAFFVDPRLSSTNAIIIPRKSYLTALSELHSQFPESDPIRPDADHAWLTPVKSNYDIQAIAELVAEGRISGTFVSAVLAIDFTNPVFSKDRCQLLRLVPVTETAGWQSIFQKQLSQSDLPGAQELASTMTQTTDRPQTAAKALLAACATRYRLAGETKGLVNLLFQRRAEAFASDISKNPLGQILEPAFRVIFPKMETPATGDLKLDPVSCAVK